MADVSKKLPSALVKIFLYVLLVDLVFIFVFPFLYMVVTSLKDVTDINDALVNWVPRRLAFSNYVLALDVLEYGKYAFNSVFITVMATVGHLFSCSFVGYGFARYNFPGKKLLTFFLVVAFIVPVQTIIVPLYMSFANLQWLNTYLPLIVPTFFGFGLKGALFIFLFRQYYMSLPKELEEAAYIDGSGPFKTYFTIVLPLAQAIFIVTVVLSVVWHWNDFYEPSLYISDKARMILPSRLNIFVTLLNNPPAEMAEQLIENPITNAVIMAATCLVIAPVVLCFTILQKQFVQGIERAGLTGE